MTGTSDSPHVFLSYSNQDKDAAERLAAVLTARGLPVWWDTDIPVGVHYPQVIEDALKGAGCVVVLWSRHSSGSRWVRNEADWGAESGSLVPVRIDDTEIPWEFRNFQTLDLSGWKGATADPVLDRLVEGIAARLAAGPAAGATAPPPQARRGGATVGSRGFRRPLLIAAAAAALVAAVAWLVPRGAGNSTTSPGSERTFTPLTGSGRAHAAALHPDGTLLAYTDLADGAMSLRQKQIGTGSESVLVPAGPQGLRSPVYSRDGQFVYFTRSDGGLDYDNHSTAALARVSVLGGPAETIAAGILGRRFDGSPAGDRVAALRPRGLELDLVLIRVDGSGTDSLATLALDKGIPPCLAWAADGARIYTSRRDTASGKTELLAFPAAGGPPTVLPGRPWQAVLDLRALEDGSGLLVLGQPSWTGDLNVDLWRLPLQGGEPEAITDDITFYHQISADRSGRRIALNHYAHKRTLRVAEPAAGTSTDISTEIVANGQVAWLDDGHLLVNQLVGSTVGLAVLGLDGSVAGLPTGGAYVGGLAVSPDGRRIAYRTTAGNEHHLWLAAADGSGKRLLTADGHIEYAPSFTAAGDELVFARREDHGGPYHAWRRTLDGASEQRLDDRSARGPEAAPDSAYAVAQLWDTAREEFVLHLIPYDGAPARPLDVPGPAEILGWMPGSRAITVSRRDGAEIVVSEAPLDGGGLRELVRYPAAAGRIVDGAWDRSGRRLALCLQSVAFDITLLER